MTARPMTLTGGAARWWSRQLIGLGVVAQLGAIAATGEAGWILLLGSPIGLYLVLLARAARRRSPRAIEAAAFGAQVLGVGGLVVAAVLTLGGSLPLAGAAAVVGAALLATRAERGVARGAVGVGVALALLGASGLGLGAGLAIAAGGVGWLSALRAEARGGGLPRAAVRASAAPRGRTPAAGGAMTRACTLPCTRPSPPSTPRSPS